jgi:hypothetical protein
MNILCPECSKLYEGSFGSKKIVVDKINERREEDFYSFDLFPILRNNKVYSTDETFPPEKNKDGEVNEEESIDGEEEQSEEVKEYVSEDAFDYSKEAYPDIDLLESSEDDQNDLEVGSVSSSGTICAVLQGNQYFTYNRSSPRKKTRFSTKRHSIFLL